eukprot:jgi/Mesen1/3065/ME000018S02373
MYASAVLLQVLIRVLLAGTLGCPWRGDCNMLRICSTFQYNSLRSITIPSCFTPLLQNVGKRDTIKCAGVLPSSIRMVYIENGVVHKVTKKENDEQGRFVRESTRFRERVVFAAQVEEGAPPRFPAEAGRYHLIVSLACPWALRTALMRAIKGLQGAISLSVVHPVMEASHGWHFVRPGERDERYPECEPDPLLGAEHLHQIYLAADGNFTGKVTVPLLWDKKTNSIVNNESPEILEMLNSEFDAFAANALAPDFYPPSLRAEIDEACALALRVNDGVSRCGYAASQAAYEEACTGVFAALDELEARLASRRFLVDTTKLPQGEQKEGGPGWAVPQPTLADWWLLPSLVPFDPVFYSLFKCNLRHLRDYPNLHAYMTDLHAYHPGVAQTISLRHLKDGFYKSLLDLNPKAIVPLGDSPFPLEPPLQRRWLGLPEETTGEAAQPGGGAGAAAAAAAAAAAESAGQGGGAKAAAGGVKGAFVRQTAAFRKHITADGSSGYPAEAGRYHLYLANNCPWCHRVALTRAVLGLEGAISRDVVWFRRDPAHGWQLNPDEPGCTPDTVNGGIKFIEELYQREGSTQRSVPVLWDKVTGSIISNESGEIIRMLALEFTALHRPGAPALYPAPLRAGIDEVNAWVYECINNGAYKSGFASTQEAYEAAYANFFAALDRLELRLRDQRWVMGAEVTEADVRLFPTIFRFDQVYYIRFQLNKALLVDSYPNLQRWMMDFYNLPGVKAASDIEHCKKGYFGAAGNKIVPIGPDFKFP